MCVCVLFLFCSVVVLFGVGRQQHCRYIVIDAMVYPRNWILEDELSTGKTLGVYGLSLVFLHLVFCNREDFEFGSYDIMHESNEMSFWMMLYHLPCVLEDVCFFGYLLIMDMIWDANIFLRIIQLVSVPGSDVCG